MKKDDKWASAIVDTSDIIRPYRNTISNEVVYMSTLEYAIRVLDFSWEKGEKVWEELEDTPALRALYKKESD